MSRKLGILPQGLVSRLIINMDTYGSRVHSMRYNILLCQLLLVDALTKIFIQFMLVAWNGVTEFSYNFNSKSISKLCWQCLV